MQLGFIPKMWQPSFPDVPQIPYTFTPRQQPGKRRGRKPNPKGTVTGAGEPACNCFSLSPSVCQCLLQRCIWTYSAVNVLSDLQILQNWHFKAPVFTSHGGRCYVTLWWSQALILTHAIALARPTAFAGRTGSDTDCPSHATRTDQAYCRGSDIHYTPMKITPVGGERERERGCTEDIKHVCRADPRLGHEASQSRRGRWQLLCCQVCRAASGGHLAAGQGMQRTYPHS